MNYNPFQLWNHGIRHWIPSFAQGELCRVCWLRDRAFVVLPRFVWGSLDGKSAEIFVVWLPFFANQWKLVGGFLNMNFIFHFIIFHIWVVILPLTFIFFKMVKTTNQKATKVFFPGSFSKSVSQDECRKANFINHPQVIIILIYFDGCYKLSPVMVGLWH